MKWLNSLDELLYEVMSWTIFFPLTLWRAATRPVATMMYAEEQLALPPEQQYRAAMSPPLVLTLGLLISSGLAVALGEANPLVADQRGLARLIKDDTTLTVLRVVILAFFPLIMATLFVRGAHAPLDRETLRGPFYAQCYTTAVFALALSTGFALGSAPHGAASLRTAGDALVATGFVYYLVAETRWFAARLKAGLVRAGLRALSGVVLGFVALFAVGSLFVHPAA